MEANRGVKEVYWCVIDKDGEGWSLHTPSDLVGPFVMESKVFQGLVKELLAHLIIGSLHIKLDSHEVIITSISLKVMHELLSNRNIVGDALAIHECTLFWVDQMEKNELLNLLTRVLAQIL